MTDDGQGGDGHDEVATFAPAGTVATPGPQRWTPTWLGAVRSSHAEAMATAATFLGLTSIEMARSASGLGGALPANKQNNGFDQITIQARDFLQASAATLAAVVHDADGPPALDDAVAAMTAQATLTFGAMCLCLEEIQTAGARSAPTGLPRAADAVAWHAALLDDGFRCLEAVLLPRDAAAYAQAVRTAQAILKTGPDLDAPAPSL